jgi:hypothetical protein
VGWKVSVWFVCIVCECYHVFWLFGEQGGEACAMFLVDLRFDEAHFWVCVGGIWWFGVCCVLFTRKSLVLLSVGGARNDVAGQFLLSIITQS